MMQNHSGIMQKLWFYSPDVHNLTNCLFWSCPNFVQEDKSFVRGSSSLFCSPEIIFVKHSYILFTKIKFFYNLCILLRFCVFHRRSMAASVYGKK